MIYFNICWFNFYICLSLFWQEPSTKEISWNTIKTASFSCWSQSSCEWNDHCLAHIRNRPIRTAEHNQYRSAHNTRAKIEGQQTKFINRTSVSRRVFLVSKIPKHMTKNEKGGTITNICLNIQYPTIFNINQYIIFSYIYIYIYVFVFWLLWHLWIMN